MAKQNRNRFYFILFFIRVIKRSPNAVVKVVSKDLSFIFDLNETEKKHDKKLLKCMISGEQFNHV